MEPLRIDLYIHVVTPAQILDPRMDQVLTDLSILTRKLTLMSDSITAELTALQADVQNEVTVEASAMALIEGFPALIAAAVAQAQSAGATPTQLAAFATLDSQIKTSANALAAAVSANTPAASGSVSGATGSTTTTAPGAAG